MRIHRYESRNHEADVDSRETVPGNQREYRCRFASTFKVCSGVKAHYTYCCKSSKNLDIFLSGVLSLKSILLT